MAKNLTFSELSDLLNKASLKVQTEVKGIVGFNLAEIEQQAIRNAPGPGQSVKTQNGTEKESDIRKARPNSTTAISQAIGVTMDPSGYKGQVYVDKSAGPIAAWVEFGTGQSAASYLMTVPPDWRDLAKRYYINGRGTILTQPYILPAFLKYSVRFEKEMRKTVKDMLL